MNPDVAADLKELSTTLSSIEAVMDIAGLRKRDVIRDIYSRAFAALAFE